MNWLKNRASAPSSYAALAGLGGVLIPLIPAQYQWIAQLLGVLFAGAGVGLPERK